MALLMPATAQACSPWAEKVVALDGAADLAVVAVWIERDHPPATRESLTPDQYELRRLSNGEGLAMHLCPDPPAGKGEGEAGPDCPWQGAFPDTPAAKTTWANRGVPLPRGKVRVSATSAGGATDFALESFAAGKWQRVLWLDRISPGYPERRRYKVLSAERWSNNIVLTLAYHSRGGNCRHTAVRFWRISETDLADPTNSSRQSRMLAQVRQDAPLGYWRTVGELGPIPAERLLEAMEAAEAAGRSDLGVLWWRASVTSIPAEQLAALKHGLARHAGLVVTRAALRPRPDAGP